MIKKDIAEVSEPLKEEIKIEPKVEEVPKTEAKMEPSFEEIKSELKSLAEEFKKVKDNLVTKDDLKNIKENIDKIDKILSAPQFKARVEQMNSELNKTEEIKSIEAKKSRGPVDMIY